MHTKFQAQYGLESHQKQSMFGDHKEKIMNRKDQQRRYTAKMTVGDTESEVFTCRFDPTDKFLACGFGDGAIRIYNTQNGKCAYTLCDLVTQDGQSDEMPVTSLRWRPQN